MNGKKQQYMSTPLEAKRPLNPLNNSSHSSGVIYLLKAHFLVSIRNFVSAILEK